jgi:uncharacterized protein with GYD domain
LPGCSRRSGRRQLALKENLWYEERHRRKERRVGMPIFMMFGKYTAEALKGISPERTDAAVELIKNNGGKVISMYAVLGEHDLVFTLDFPDTDKALATSVALNKLTGISFMTSPVVEVEKFDKLMAEAKNI